MAILLTNGKYYIKFSDTGSIIKTNDIKEAQDFSSVERATDQIKKAPRKCSGYFCMDTETEEMQREVELQGCKGNGNGGSYVVTNGVYFLSLDADARVVITDSLTDAHIFTTEIKCKNIIKSHLSKVKGWYYVQIGGNRPIANCDRGQEKMRVAIDRPITKTEIDDDFSQIKELSEQLELKYLKCKAKLDIIEKEIIDIYHAMEFYDLSASRGYKVYKMMQVRLRNRRKMKDEMQKIEIILSSKLGKDSIEKAEKQIVHMDARGYIPRVLIELFES